MCKIFEDMLNETEKNQIFYFENKETINMCYAIEYLIKEASEKAAKEAAREASILTLIECYREVDMTESEIKERVMNKFSLTREETDRYMFVKKA